MDDCRLGDRVKSQSSQLIEEAWCDVLSSLPPPTGPVKRPASQNPSLGGILKRHITIREFENNETEIQRTEQEKVKALLSKFGDVSKRDKLVAFVRLFKRLDPLVSNCKKKLECIDNGRKNSIGSESIDLESLVAYGRRIAAHVRSPPEYNDSSGTDGLCVPGYFFPCPDNLTISRSVLFQADKIRAVSPTISFTPDPRTRAMYWIDVKTPTPNPVLRYSINNTSSWNIYNPNQKPFITGPGYYVVRSYCQSEGYLISEVTIAEIDVPAPSSSGDMEILTRVVEATTRGGNSGIVELSPSIESVSAPQSSVSSKHSSAILSNVQTSSNPEDSSTLKSSERLPVEEKKRPEKLPASAKFGGLFLSGGDPSDGGSDNDDLNNDDSNNDDSNNDASDDND